MLQCITLTKSTNQYVAKNQGQALLVSIHLSVCPANFLFWFNSLLIVSLKQLYILDWFRCFLCRAGLSLLIIKSYCTNASMHLHDWFPYGLLNHVLAFACLDVTGLQSKPHSTYLGVACSQTCNNSQWPRALELSVPEMQWLLKNNIFEKLSNSIFNR